MKNKRKITAISALCFVMIFSMLLMTSCSDKEKENQEIEKNKVIFSGGSTFNGYIKAVAGEIETVIEDLEFDIDSKGSVINNISKVADGNADFAMSRGDVLYQAYNGVGLFEGKAAPNIRVVTGCYAEACQLVVSPESEINSIEDIKGRTVAVGEANSLTEMNFLKILELMKINESDFEKINMSYKDSLEALKNGEIDGVFIVAGEPVTGVMKLAVTGNAELVPITGESIKKQDIKDSYFIPHTIPAGTYTGQEKDVETLAIKTAVITREDVSEDTVYRITKALFETKEASAEKFEKCGELDEERALEGMIIPVHEGANRYYKEIGVL